MDGWGVPTIDIDGGGRCIGATMQGPVPNQMKKNDESRKPDFHDLTILFLYPIHDVFRGYRIRLVQAG